MKKIIALMLAVVFALSMIACSSDNAKTTSTAETKTEAKTGDADSTNKDEKKTLVMGTSANFPPYEYIENEKITGIDAEIAAAIAEKLGMELEIKDMEFESIIPAVTQHSIDIGLAGMTVNEERLESVNFSDSYAKGVQVVIVTEDSSIATIDDLEGKKIGVQSGTTGDIYCTDDYGQENVKQFTNGALATAALKNGQVDCVVIDSEPAKAFVASNTGLKILKTTYADEDYAAAIAKDNEELLKKVNDALAELKSEGKLDAIINKYIPAEGKAE